jgi:hypothetical protein
VKSLRKRVSNIPCATVTFSSGKTKSGSNADTARRGRNNKENDYKITAWNLSNGFIAAPQHLVHTEINKSGKENRIFCRHRKVIRDKLLYAFSSSHCFPSLLLCECVKEGDVIKNSKAEKLNKLEECARSGRKTWKWCFSLLRELALFCNFLDFFLKHKKIL